MNDNPTSVELDPGNKDTTLTDIFAMSMKASNSRLDSSGKKNIRLLSAKCMICM
jgi:hypothetical protein